MLETAALIGRDGNVLYWHEPDNRSAVFIPDSSTFWDAIWSRRKELAGIAHTHPGTGMPHPSQEDVSTFFAIEKALGRPLLWWIGSQDSMILVTTQQKHLEVVIKYLDGYPDWMVEIRNRSKYF